MVSIPETSCIRSDSSVTSTQPSPQVMPEATDERRVRDESGVPVASTAPAGRCVRGPALGTYALNSSPLDPINCAQAQKTRGLRAARYALQNVIRKLILTQSGYESSQLVPMDEYRELPRVIRCARTQVASTVDLNLETATNRAYFKNVYTCGSPWSCPLCAAKIMEQRRQDIANAMEWAGSEGLKPVMVSFTSPHYSHQRCDDLLESFSSALKYFRSGKAHVKFRDRVGMQGFVRSMETLYGVNGWHTHTHELWFVNADVDLDEMRAYIVDRWEKACDKQGLIPRGKRRAFRARAVDVRTETTKGEYLAKQDDEKYLGWGLDREMTGGFVKSSTRGSYHPFTLALSWHEGNEKHGELFCEYLEAFKGKRAIYFSPGLKKKVESYFDDELLIDEEAAVLEPEEYETLMTLEYWGYREIVKRKAQALILDMAETQGVDAVYEWLKEKGVHDVPVYAFPQFRRRVRAAGTGAQQPPPPSP